MVTTSPSENSRSKRLPWGLLLLCSWAAYAAGVMLVDSVNAGLGRALPSLEKHLLVMALPGLAASHDGGALGMGLLALGYGLYRWIRLGRRVDTPLVLGVAAGVVVAISVPYASAAVRAYAGQHAQALATAVGQGDRKRVREVVFGCEVICGFDRDSGPLVWLVSVAQSDADFNAMGAMLNRSAPRNAQSQWLPDRRTPLQAAVERYAEQPQLAPYLLGISRVNFHFTVARAAQEDMDATLIYAIQRRAPLPLIVDMLESGANPEAVQGTANAIVAARAASYEAALVEIQRARPGFKIN